MTPTANHVAVRVLALGLCLSGFVFTAAAAEPDGNSASKLSPYLDEFSFYAMGDLRAGAGGEIQSMRLGHIGGEIITSEFVASGFFFAGGSVEIREGTVEHELAHSPLFLEAGLFGKRYFTKPHVFMRPYITGGLSLCWMAWDYRSPYPTSSGDTVHSDHIYGLDAYVGAGVSLKFHDSLKAFGEVFVGGVGFWDKSTNDVDRNFFDDFAYSGVRVGLCWSF